MHPKGIVWVLGVLVILYGLSMLLPTYVAIHYATGHVWHFLLVSMALMLAGVAMCRYGRKPERLGHRDGFLIVAASWILLSLIGALPFLTTGTCSGFVDAVFESASGLTTTGATVLTGLDHMPPSILFWRSMQQWFGGMGIIVLAVAILPFLGIGGMQLYRAEVPGMIKDKLTSRITHTGKALWAIYFGMTLLMALALWWAGMGVFDAINHAMTTVSTGGFSTHDASLGYFHSPLITVLVSLFMLIAGVNFSLHFAWLWKGFSASVYFQDAEFRAYMLWVLLLFAAIVLLPGQQGRIEDVLFSVISVVTTTGFSTMDYGQWPAAALLLIFLAMMVGGCAGSTAGGMKVVRMLLLLRQGRREILRLIHPHAVLPVKMGGVVVQPRMAEALWGFFVLFILSSTVIVFLLMLTGVPALEAISATFACVGNVGPGFGNVGPAGNYAALPDPAKMLLAVGMIMGRLEVFTLLALLTPAFWDI